MVGEGEYLSGLCLVGAAAAFFPAVHLITAKSGPILANQILGAFLGISIFKLLFYWLLYHYMFMQFPYIYLLLSVDGASGALLYLYVCALTIPDWKLKPTHWAYMVVPVISVTYIFLRKFGDDPKVDDISDWFWMPHEAFTSLIDGNELLTTLIGLVVVFGFAAIWLLIKHETQIKEEFSNLENLHLRWVWLIVGLFIVDCVGTMITEMLYSLWEIYSGPRFTVAIAVNCLQLLIISYYGSKQDPIYVKRYERKVGRAAAERIGADSFHAHGNKDDELKDVSSPVSEQDTKYKKSSLTEERAATYWQKLKKLMEEEQLYRSNISRTELAAELDISPHHLSQTLAQHECNYRDFMNDYRIKEACELIAESDMTLEFVCLDVGFGSYDSFGKAFKKHQHCSPSQYRKQVMKERAELAKRSL